MMTATEREVRATRSDWTLTTWADGFGAWHCKVVSDAGWGNYGTRDIGWHIRAMRERARRAIRAEIQARQGATVGNLGIELTGTQGYGDGVTFAVIFSERTA